MIETVDVVVVGGGPAGATAATDLAGRGRSVLLLDRAGRIKPCGGAIPPKLLEDFAVPESLLVARITSARMVSPSSRNLDIPIERGFVGMVDREVFDEWLRQRAAACGAERRAGTVERLSRDKDGVAVVHYRPSPGHPREALRQVRARAVIGADGARSAVARQAVPGADRMRHVFAYHEIVHSPADGRGSFDGSRCDIYYQGALSPDFYGWVFPHGKTTSIGIGTAQKGFPVRRSAATLRQKAGLGDVDTVRREAAPIPLRPLRRWDNGRDVLLVGDAAGVVAPASGEGIYYAMVAAQLAAEAIDLFLAAGDARTLTVPRKRFMNTHGQIFWILGMMERFWYADDRRRERFVNICRDPSVQRLTFEAYMQKKLVRAKASVHARILIKDLARLLGLVPV